jgi:hypothetical protein
MNGLIKVIVAEFDGESYWIDDNYKKTDEFVLQYDELVDSKNLYKTYIVSLLTTANPYNLSYHKSNKQKDWTSTIMDCKFCIETKKLKKGLYFDQHYSQSYGFDYYPTCILIDDEEENAKLKKHYLNIFKNDDEWLVSCNSKCINDFISEQINDYIEHCTDYIEYTIENMEKDIAVINKYNIFTSKVCYHKNLTNDMKLYILQKLCNTLI